MVDAVAVQNNYEDIIGAQREEDPLNHCVEVLFNDSNEWTRIGFTIKPYSCLEHAEGQSIAVTLPMVFGTVIINRSAFKAIRVMQHPTEREI